jgi:hypothetical protein
MNHFSWFVQYKMNAELVWHVNKYQHLRNNIFKKIIKTIFKPGNQTAINDSRRQQCIAIINKQWSDVTVPVKHGGTAQDSYSLLWLLMLVNEHF